jgi:PIN domain nuclease of toxin-antitoxin system
MTRLLLDTNIIIWLSEKNPRIDSIHDLIISESVETFISAVSWWEIAIKIRIGKLSANLYHLMPLALNSGFRELPLTGKYAEVLTGLPKIHNDPFDHMLLAQAITEPMRLITGDAILAEYSSLVMAI